MPARLWRRWRLFWEATPFGPRRDEERTALIATLLEAPYLKKGRAGTSPEGFCPSLAPRRDEGEARRRDPVQQAAAWRAWVLGEGGRIVERGKVTGQGPQQRRSE